VKAAIIEDSRGGAPRIRADAGAPARSADALEDALVPTGTGVQLFRWMGDGALPYVLPAAAD
jgi:hypothetical protein